MGQFTIESAFPSGMELDGWSGLNVTGNSAGRQIRLHKFWFGEDRALRLTPANPTASEMARRPAAMASAHALVSHGFTMGAFSPTSPLSWQVPFTFSPAVMVAGTFLDTYSVWIFQRTTIGPRGHLLSTRAAIRSHPVQPGTGYCLMYENTYKCPGPSKCSTKPITQCTKCRKPDSPKPFYSGYPVRHPMRICVGGHLARDQECRRRLDRTVWCIFTGKGAPGSRGDTNQLLRFGPDKLIRKCSRRSLRGDKHDRKAHLIGLCGNHPGSVCLRKSQSYCTMKSRAWSGWFRNKAVCSWA